MKKYQSHNNFFFGVCVCGEGGLRRIDYGHMRATKMRSVDSTMLSLVFRVFLFCESRTVF